MDTKSVWDLLSGISIGTIVAWVIVIVAIVTCLCTGTVKLYKAFAKYREVKDTNEKYKNTINRTSEKLDEVCETIDKLYSEFEQQRLINYKKTRYSIVKTCDEALRKGEISANKYKSLIEMYEEYCKVFADMKPNGYVHNMIERVEDPQQVKIVGKLDE
jgi:DNA-binding transcriptional regulator YhcF (GntR family)